MGSVSGRRSGLAVSSRLSNVLTSTPLQLQVSLYFQAAGRIGPIPVPVKQIWNYQTGVGKIWPPILRHVHLPPRIKEGL